eukprot:GHVH01014368.1.p1 GENE.GHVH01014368.1~~GHVH01014368.1.p1  ORF type:complete len:303 (-),score=35.87 GHVH01014368.1:247-1155(-)
MSHVQLRALKASPGKLQWMPTARIQWMVDTAHFDDKLVMTAVDPYSRLVHAQVMKENKALVAAVFIIGQKAKYPTTQIIVVDGGPEFRWKGLARHNEVISEILASLNIRMVTVRPHHYQGRANVERFIGTLKEKWRTSQQGKLEDHISRVCDLYNRTRHTITGWKPIEVQDGSISTPKDKKESVMTNVQPGERLFELKKPIDHIGYDFKRLPLETTRIKEMVAGIVTVQEVSGSLISIKRSNGQLDRVPEQLLHKPRRAIVEPSEVSNLTLQVAEIVNSVGGIPSSKILSDQFDSSKKRRRR